MMTPCTDCGGTGKCPTCDGKGTVQKQVKQQDPCPDCKGSGSCSDCGGSGMMNMPGR